MITDFIITIVYNVIYLLVNLIALLPDVTLPSAITSSLNDVSSYYKGIETVFPISTLFDILAVELFFIGGYFTYKLIRWAYIKIPTIN